MPPNDPPIKILRIPASGSPVKIVSTTTRCNTAGVKTKMGYDLGHLPNPGKYWGDWPHEWGRKTVCVWEIGRNPEDPQTWDEGVFVLLKTMPLEGNLPINKNEKWRHIEDRKVWGDAFLCKLGQPAIVEGWAHYVDMPEEIIDSPLLGMLMVEAATSDGFMIILDDNRSYPHSYQPVYGEASGSHT